MKRFYTVVSTEKVAEGYHILLDGRPVKTKSGVFLCAVNEDIATSVLKEWADQIEDIVPDTMPFTQILNTRIDRVSSERDVMSVALLKYLNTDLLCYPTAIPEELAALQKTHWQPWLDWFEKAFGCELHTTTALAAVTHPDAAHQAVADYVLALDDERFTILQIVTSVSGSLILALAMVQGVVSAQQALDACFVEETFKDALYNAEKYGDDPMLEKQKKSAMLDFTASADYIALLD